MPNPEVVASLGSRGRSPLSAIEGPGLPLLLLLFRFNQALCREVGESSQRAVGENLSKVPP